MSTRILIGDVRDRLADLPDGSVQCVVTSPPYYGLRDYGTAGQIGLEPTLSEYVQTMVDVFREVRRVLRDDGTVWLNLGDSYAANRGNGASSVGEKQATNTGSLLGKLTVPDGLKPKDLMMVPARVVLALQDDGWYLRSDIIWAKPNPMPESCRDRPTSAHEHIFLLTKSARYYFDQEAVRQPLSEASVARLSQETFDQQTGGPKDYGISGVNPSRSGRQTLNNLHEKFVKQDKWQSRYEGWDERDKSIGANIRNVWTIPTFAYPDAHFATFPPEIPRRCIKAGTSEKGQCPACGAPWKRQTETTYRTHENWFGDKQGSRHSRGAAGTSYNEPIGSETLGWSPSCTCNAGEPVPQTVLDPFAGAGTTLLVADQLGRHGIGIELNPAYAEMARNRIYNDAPMLVRLVAD